MENEDVLAVYQEFVDAGEFVPDEVVDALAADVREQRARAERAERVAVEVARRGLWVQAEPIASVRIVSTQPTPSSRLIVGDDLPAIPLDGTDADLYRALVEACEGGDDSEG